MKNVLNKRLKKGTMEKEIFMRESSRVKRIAILECLIYFLTYVPVKCHVLLTQGTLRCNIMVFVLVGYLVEAKKVSETHFTAIELY